MEHYEAQQQERQERHQECHIAAGQEHIAAEREDIAATRLSTQPPHGYNLDTYTEIPIPKNNTEEGNEGIDQVSQKLAIGNSECRCGPDSGCEVCSSPF